ncbi:KilA-N domain-containing protein [Klebsiella pneumoniae]|uniref:KilA-N domain-containing protein n=1 Tax=Klebsiella TaxID=570 RepID=UPI0006697155|nr:MULTISPECIES: KilA-N domain-containing protein [Klebsiella]PLJ57209.1 hypothetical protein B6J70_18925 [Klebsiella pneumoniae]WRT34928.1 KilA-N domain-containing protein [Klebsiella pneumoniae]
MKYPTVSVNGVSVRVDDEGRYNLNDLHAAAVANGEATEQQRPSQFLRSAQIKRFIKALKAKVQKSTLEQIQPLKVEKDLRIWMLALAEKVSGVKVGDCYSSPLGLVFLSLMTTKHRTERTVAATYRAGSTGPDIDCL